ncbi:hypothetical protein MF271_19375 (plasmid) [Deinococcus sp. KNUC1210]|uniref:hypothetical protein n=1 Tax=Deinococcus sp. KNUC1210 TaxID=2917691 RepID=UPI001EF123E0|nr:hypothetical protein [Deinococcus sp. KNUC1210]ULH17353.1 hypothetical protein MF271_19375 [Deinococcus sp. KNUC1210]
MDLQAEGSIDAMLASIDRLNPQLVSNRLNTLWAEDAEARLKEKFEDGPSERYYTSRSGASRRSIHAEVTATGGVLSVSGPGVRANEFGADIEAKAGNWLTFRLFNPGDTDERTGNWVRVRKVTLKAKHAVRDSADEALAALQIHLLEALH